MTHADVPRTVPDAEAFDHAVFLGLARQSKRDPYRLGLFAKHLDAGETALALLAVQGGTLVLTDRRLIEFRAHLEVHGAWNVKEFQGYEVRRAWDRTAVVGLDHAVRPAASGGAGAVEDVLLLRLPDREETITVSRGPEPTLSGADFDVLQAMCLRQAK